METAFLILPIHLFDHSILLENIKSYKDQLKTIYILEEPVYFGDRDVKLNFNKLKLIYHRATMKYYFNYLHKYIPNGIELVYLEYNELKNVSKTIIGKGFQQIKKAHSKIIMFNPVDTYLEAKYKKIFGSKLKDTDILESPLFLCTNKDLEDYQKQKPKTNKSRESYFHTSFYNWQRQRMNILGLPNKTYDTENRNMMPADTQVPPLPKNDSKTPATKKYIDEAIQYVQSIWNSNLEPVYAQTQQEAKQEAKPKSTSITASSILFPITRKTSLQWLENFCQNRFDNFGKYEDSIDAGQQNTKENTSRQPRNFLFHSCITPMLNIGLITPQDVLSIITKHYNSNKAKIGIANYEGFIRQIIGWREYQRYIYQYAGNTMREGNYFNNSGKLTPEWYNGTIGIKPVDDAIKMAVNDGYIHHILRLMVVGNFMNLVGIHPDEVYKWFMEFAMDSYDWVMVGNVYSMALWADGGITMRKPYISGDGYIMKMSNYSKGDWNAKWNAVFHHFIDRNSKQLENTYYNGVVKAWARKGKEEKEKEMVIANEIIKKISK
jgi:deoxyribodipyrimidine photolyase-related protein